MIEHTVLTCAFRARCVITALVSTAGTHMWGWVAWVGAALAVVGPKLDLHSLVFLLFELKGESLN